MKDLILDFAAVEPTIFRTLLRFPVALDAFRITFHGGSNRRGCIEVDAMVRGSFRNDTR